MQIDELTLVFELIEYNRYMGLVQEIPSILVIGETYPEAKQQIFNALHFHFACKGLRLPGRIHLHHRFHLPHQPGSATAL